MAKQAPALCSSAHLLLIPPQVCLPTTQSKAAAAQFQRRKWNLLRSRFGFEIACSKSWFLVSWPVSPKNRDGSGRLVQKLLVQARVDHSNSFSEDGIQHALWHVLPENGLRKFVESLHRYGESRKRLIGVPKSR